MDRVDRGQFRDKIGQNRFGEPEGNYKWNIATQNDPEARQEALELIKWLQKPVMRWNY